MNTFKTYDVCIWFLMYVYTFESKKKKKSLQAKCKSCKPVLSQVKVFWYQGVDLRRWPIYSHLQKACEVIVRNMWGKCMCKHLNPAPPPLACEIGQKNPASQMQAKCKLCKPVLSEVKVFWYPGVDFRRWPICTHYNKHVRSLWGTCEAVWGTCEVSVRNIWGQCEG